MGISYSCLLIVISLCLISSSRVAADPVTPGNILEPKTPVEAWNVIRLATKNVERLLEENRLEEIPVQASYCSPSLRVPCLQCWTGPGPLWPCRP